MEKYEAIYECINEKLRSDKINIEVLQDLLNTAIKKNEELEKENAEIKEANAKLEAENAELKLALMN